MKIFALIGIVMLIAGCTEVVTPEVAEEVCVGKLEKITDLHFRMTCDNGKIINYTSYKYPIIVK